MKHLIPYDQPTTLSEGSLEDRSIGNNLRRRKKNLEEQLEKVNAALDALDKQPEVADLLETIMKVI